MKSFHRILQRLECPVDKDADWENSYWCNRDLIPMPPERRTWTWQGFVGFWAIAGINPSTWTIGSTLLALGLNVAQAMGIVIVGCAIIATLAVLGGWMGSHQHIGFTVTSRSAWGMRGAFWPVLNRVMAGCVWMGVQMYWGGLAIRIVLNAIIGPKFIFMKNTLPPSANIETANLISFFVFLIVLGPLMQIAPERLQVPFRIAFIMATSVVLGMLIWSLSAAGGAGNLITVKTTAGGSTLSWNMLYGLQSFLGAWSGGFLGQSDWTRYARHPHGALFGQAFTAPLAISLTALFGILISSAASQLYGQIFWNPFLLLLHIQTTLTASSRAGTFFAGLSLLSSQLALCIVTNSVASAMDLTTLLPKYINIRRGSWIILIIGIAIVPWNLVNQASRFIVVLSGWSIFFAPMTGVLIADYFVVHRRELHLADLYVGNSTSAYWYSYGVNWRAVLAWAMGIWPLLPGFVRKVQGVDSQSGWDRLYDMNYLMGFSFSFVVHVVLSCALFPVPAVSGRGSSPFVWTDRGVLAGEKIDEDVVGVRDKEVGEKSTTATASVQGASEK